MTTLLIATGNAHKVEEIRQILGTDFRYLTLVDFPGAPKVIEDAETFAGNAEKKARALAVWSKQHPPKPPYGPLYIVADDSGLEVDALSGAPGVRSARFATGENADEGNSPDSANNAKLLKMLGGLGPEKRTARFRCVLAVVQQDHAEDTNLFEGSCEGAILDSATGAGGFGYDPLFVPQGFAQSFAELGAEEKNKLSHRARALEKFSSWLRKRQAATAA
jgi:XTP/dITP diphosphohydrolase